ncbi:HesB/YadR/YfhF family protein [Bacillus pseudomycoides]|uniref:Cytoplasmic protein n=1 Tax=Bacillus pseudomycoides TaxID=64104 RepID=A0A2B4MVE7_9BACI|nr:cytoplasmic protein [Bacillus pseudomycoides]PDY44391.1 cytoplasmic protein [Bacillus pseudomycoides]PEA84254.1 cytoplasmic protein [Bacillus pseudomycoides]PED07385.1 cytoplasmic protein [Bacillus pseudomycoides]PED71157.1 cytoplasmic protein [Bacillus pseudomycoides]PEI37931.1 cytoplasmic protein [Bacillus pseudomycoides]
MIVRNNTFYEVLYGDNSTIQPSYSLGVAFEVSEDIAASVEQDGIQFFVDSDDIWYFRDYDLVVSYHKEMDEIEFNYVK